MWGPWGWGGDRVVACRDVGGRSARVIVTPTSDGSEVLLSAPGGGPLRLTVRQARRLGRALLADPSPHSRPGR